MTRTRTRAAGVAAALAGSFLGALATPAWATPPSGRETAAIETVQLRQTAAADEPADCSRLRKRLWIANEGWVVRRVTICR